MIFRLLAVLFFLNAFLTPRVEIVSFQHETVDEISSAQTVVGLEVLLRKKNEARTVYSWPDSFIDHPTESYTFEFIYLSYHHSPSESYVPWLTSIGSQSPPSFSLV